MTSSLVVSSSLFAWIICMPGHPKMMAPRSEEVLQSKSLMLLELLVLKHSGTHSFASIMARAMNRNLVRLKSRFQKVSMCVVPGGWGLRSFMLIVLSRFCSLEKVENIYNKCSHSASHSSALCSPISLAEINCPAEQQQNFLLHRFTY